jgi:dTDP-glucose 4,6-dehydratase
MTMLLMSRSSNAKVFFGLSFFSFLFFTSLIFSTDFFDSHNTLTRKYNKKTVFLTGACGFIGSNFLKYMFDKYPEYHFDVLDLLTYAGSLDNIPEYIRKSDRFHFYYGSVTNIYLVDYLMSHASYVVHFAAESHVTRSINDDTIFFDTDVMGTRVMVSALVKYAKSVERYIHISTSEVLGTAELIPMDENHPIKPRSPYAAAKAGADRLVYAYWCTYDIPALIIRPFNNYGPQQHLEKMIPRFITSVLNGNPITVHGTGEQQRDWIHTYDLARALDLAFHIEDFSKIKNEVIHIGSGIATSVLDIAKEILTYFKFPDSCLKFICDRPGQVACHISSTKKAKELLGWEPEISLKEGLVETIEWYQKNRNRWEKMDSMMLVPIYTQHGVMAQ